MRKVCSRLAALLVATTLNSAHATVFFSDEFDYTNGQLTDHNGGANVSGGLWDDHSPSPGTTLETIQVLDSHAVANINFTEDANRTTGANVLADGQTWYYGARITVNDQRPPESTDAIGTNYFMHFKDTGTFNFVGRLYVTAPTASPSSEFTFGLTSYSDNATGGELVRWGSDLPFAREYIVIVSFRALDDDGGTTNDGFSSLWVNPTSIASTSITDTQPHPDLFTLDPGTLGDRDDVSALAIRGANAGNTQPQVLIDEAAIGDNFAEVLAAVTEAVAEDNADFDGDGDIDGNDFLILQRNLTATGGTQPNGDANDDDAIDNADLDIFKTQFGTSVVAAGVVPEPASLALAAIGLTVAVGAAGRRRR